MAVKIRRGTALGTLSLTPLIDVVFLLLIFFLVATRFAEAERELEVLLPEASEAVPQSRKPSELFVNIDQSGQYFVAGQIISLPELNGALRTAWVNNPGRASVIIRADRRCPWEFVVAAVNACHKAKIHNYRVTTREGSG